METTLKFLKILPLALLALTFISANPASADGDAAKGKKVFNKCRACHSAKPGKNMTGPSLFGVIGRKAGTAKGFTRYKGLKGADWTWNEKILMEYLKDPRKYLKEKTGKNSLMVLKLRKESDRENVIAYLKTLK